MVHGSAGLALRGRMERPISRCCLKNPPRPSRLMPTVTTISRSSGTRATNSAAYDAALRQRGSLTVWFTEEAIAAWTVEPRTTRGGQPRFSALTIATALTPRALSGLALSQTEGLIGSIIALLGLDLAVPDSTMLSRLAETLQLPRPRPHRDCSPCASWWTARSRSCVAPASSCMSSMGLRRSGPGACCASAPTPTPATLTRSDAYDASSRPFARPDGWPGRVLYADSAYDQDGVYDEGCRLDLC